MLSPTYIHNFQSILLMRVLMLHADSSKLTNIRIFVRLEKGSFVTFRIFVSALFFFVTGFSRLDETRVDCIHLSRIQSLQCKSGNQDTLGPTLGAPVFGNAPVFELSNTYGRESSSPRRNRLKSAPVSKSNSRNVQRS